MKKYSHLNVSEREQIFLCLKQGKSYRQIGKILCRDHKAISAEVKRNSFENLNCSKIDYSPSVAQIKSDHRRKNSKHKKLSNPTVRHYVTKNLARGWSPEQIAGRLKLVNKNLFVSHETIYQFIYSKEAKSFRYYEFLRRGYTKRRKKNGRKIKPSKRLEIPNKKNISERSEEANERKKVGHWETDLMEGKKSTGAVLSVSTDRKSGYVLIDKLQSKKADDKSKSLIETFKYMPYHLVKTITFDNGSENHGHENIAKLLDCETFFCNAYHSWEKGTVENTIGLIRQFIPKSTDLTPYTITNVKSIEFELNTRPRKRLQYSTPSEILRREAGGVLHP